jgi:nitrite reductase/ring-hydroxylating ferredoxin subunit
MGVSYIPVARAGELSPGALKEVDLGGRAVLLTLVEGQYFAFTKDCPHEGADLSIGGQLLGGAKIRCNNHGYCFDLQSGACLIPQGGAPLTVLPVEQHGDEVCIKLEW